MGWHYCYLTVKTSVKKTETSWHHFASAAKTRENVQSVVASIKSNTLFTSWFLHIFLLFFSSKLVKFRIQKHSFLCIGKLLNINFMSSWFSSRSTLNLNFMFNKMWVSEVMQHYMLLCTFFRKKYVNQLEIASAVRWIHLKILTWNYIRLLRSD